MKARASSFEYLPGCSIPPGLTCNQQGRGLIVTRIGFFALFFGRGKR